MFRGPQLPDLVCFGMSCEDPNIVTGSVSELGFTDDFDRLFDLAKKHGLFLWLDITLATHDACPEGAPPI